MDEITKIETIDQYDQLFGLETLHPLVNVIDFSKATKTVEYYHMNIGFYSLFLKDINCGDLKYGRNYYDYQEGTVVCMAPGQVIGIDNRKKTPQRTKSIGVLFHPDLIRGTSLGQNIKNYSFFSYLLCRFVCTLCFFADLFHGVSAFLTYTYKFFHDVCRFIVTFSNGIHTFLKPFNILMYIIYSPAY